MEDLKMPIKKTMEKRSSTRNHVFNLVFQLEFFDVEEINEILNKYYDTLESEIQLEIKQDENFVPFEINKAIISRQIFDFIPRMQEIDSLIEKYSEGWDITRIDKVDLAILRLAIYEMLFDNLPIKIAVNEAVELCKEYSSEKSYRFINAILGKIDKNKIV